MHYTFRIIGENVYEVTKWENDRDHPLDTFEVRWRRGVLSATMCSCPARVPCRHLSMLKDLIESGCIDKAWEWYFEADDWHTAYDQQKWILNEHSEYTAQSSYEFSCSQKT